MMYNPGDVLKTGSTGTHVMIIDSYMDAEGEEYYRMTPLDDLDKVFMYNARWTEEELILVQSGRIEK